MNNWVAIFFSITRIYCCLGGCVTIKRAILLLIFRLPQMASAMEASCDDPQNDPKFQAMLAVVLDRAVQDGRRRNASLAADEAKHRRRIDMYGGIRRTVVASGSEESLGVPAAPASLAASSSRAPHTGASRAEPSRLQVSGGGLPATGASGSDNQ